MKQRPGAAGFQLPEGKILDTAKLKKIGMTMLVALGGYMLLNTLAKRSATVASLKNTVDNGL